MRHASGQARDQAHRLVPLGVAALAGAFAPARRHAETGSTYTGYKKLTLAMLPLPPIILIIISIDD